MQFRVVIPSGVRSGQTIRIRCPDGSEGDVKVPRGLRPGDSFIFEMPDVFPPKSSSSSSSSSASVTAEKNGFLDREIATMQDFIMALGVGLLIGGSIVLGFLLGVLAVTDPNYQVEPLTATPPPPPKMTMGV